MRDAQVVGASVVTMLSLSATGMRRERARRGHRVHPGRLGVEHRLRPVQRRIEAALAPREPLGRWSRARADALTPLLHGAVARHQEEPVGELGRQLGGRAARAAPAPARPRAAATALGPREERPAGATLGDLVQLRHEVHDAVELAHQPVEVLVAHRQLGELRDVKHVVSGRCSCALPLALEAGIGHQQLFDADFLVVEGHRDLEVAAGAGEPLIVPLPNRRCRTRSPFDVAGCVLRLLFVGAGRAARWAGRLEPATPDPRTAEPCPPEPPRRLPGRANPAPTARSSVVPRGSRAAAR